ncbi:MAG: hypothetical protein GY856_19535 [bacterium]|nr:hypothetical protein [bacterium]
MKRAVDGVESESDQLDQPALRRQVVAGILDLKQRGWRGVETLPSAVTVRIRVGRGSLDVVRRLVDDPEFDADIEADLLNRLVGARAEALPVRHYDIRTAARTSVTVAETADDALAWLEIEGGDRNGNWYPFKASAASYRVGRGPWHGPDQTLANELVLSDGDPFDSRRAAVLRRAGSSLEVEALDQEDYLVVTRPDGKRIRPTHVPRRRVRVRPGAVIEFNDGGQQVVRVRVHRRPPAGPDEGG